jgi:tRNA(Ile)-lysidine synthase
MRMDPAVAAIRLAVREDLVDVAAGDLVLVAVSGGADSLALAAAVAAQAPGLGLRAGAVTVDHSLQAGSAERATEVAATCVEFGLQPVVVETIEVGRHGGPEAAARDGRYAALDIAANRAGASAILLGHTLDDQAETVLLGLARGSGARSLAGMPARRDRLRRPLLGVRRETTIAACAALGLVPWADPHNLDPAYSRVRVRRDAMPALIDALGPGVPQALARTASMLRADTDALEQWAASIEDPCNVATLVTLPVAVRTRVLRRVAIRAGAPAGSLSAGHVFEIDRLVSDWHGQGAVSLPGGLVAERSCGRLSFR